MKKPIRQRILRFFYPVWMLFTRIKNKNMEIIKNEERSQPAAPFYSLSVLLNNNTSLSFNTLRSKKVLVVNTASNCGYTHQYAELQKLYEQYKDQLQIIAFPANDFKEQEKGSDEEIATFCQVNYGVSFPLAKKSIVVKQQQQNDVFRWLTHKELNGWNDTEPSWNFSKYLVNEQGLLTHYFGPSVSPLDSSVIEAINKNNS